MRFRNLANHFGHSPLMPLVAALAILLLEGVHTDLQAQRALDWDKVFVAVDRYISCPTESNAQALLDSLPTRRPSEMRGDKIRALTHIFTADSYPILNEEAGSGDRIAVEILFRLLNVADGNSAELVLSSLGWLVRNRPELFLQVLTANKDIEFFTEYGKYPVLLSGPGYNSHPRAKRYQLEKRIEALETVKDPEFEGIKLVCIRQLRESINRLPR